MGASAWIIRENYFMARQKFVSCQHFIGGIRGNCGAAVEEGSDTERNLLVIQLHLPEYDSKQGRDEVMSISTISDAAESCHSEDRGQSVSVAQTESCSADCGSSPRRARLSKRDAAAVPTLSVSRPMRRVEVRFRSNGTERCSQQPALY